MTVPDLRLANELINDNDIFVFNPMFRLRNRKDHVVIYGIQNIGTWKLDKISGIAVSLCNGKRTFSDIVKSLRVFSPMDSDQEAIDSIKSRLKFFFYAKLFSKEELRGDSPPQSVYPSEAILLRKEDFVKKFHDKKFPAEEYDPISFLPKDDAEISFGPFKNIHEETPLAINWHLTSDCAVNCKYCYLPRRSARLLPRERLFTLLDEATKIRVCEINLSGGDILLYPDLVEVLGYLQKRNFFPMMISTKSYLSYEKAKELSDVSSMIMDFQFSIDTDDDEIASYLVGVPNYATKIFESITNAINAGIPVTAKAVITPYNILTIPRLYRRLKSLGVSGIRLAMYSRSAYFHSDELHNHDESYKWLDQQASILRKEFPDEAIFLQNGPPSIENASKSVLKENWARRSSCPVGRSSMMICADGKVIPCEQMPETEEYFCGDLMNQSIMEVWNGDRLKEMTYGMPREKFKGQPCYDCEEREECLDVMGTCIRDLAAYYGSIYQPPPNCYRHELPFIRQT